MPVSARDRIRSLQRTGQYRPMQASAPPPTPSIDYHQFGRFCVSKETDPYGNYILWETDSPSRTRSVNASYVAEHVPGAHVLECFRVAKLTSLPVPTIPESVVVCSGPLSDKALQDSACCRKPIYFDESGMVTDSSNPSAKPASFFLESSHSME